MLTRPVTSFLAVGLASPDVPGSEAAARCDRIVGAPDLDYRAEMSSSWITVDKSPSGPCAWDISLMITSRQAVELGLSLIRSKSVGGGWDDESMTGDDQDGDQNGDQHDSTTARQAVADARREAAAAAARLAEAAVRYADATDCRRHHRCTRIRVARDRNDPSPESLWPTSCRCCLA